MNRPMLQLLFAMQSQPRVRAETSIDGADIRLGGPSRLLGLDHAAPANCLIAKSLPHFVLHYAYRPFKTPSWNTTSTGEDAIHVPTQDALCSVSTCSCAHCNYEQSICVRTPRCLQCTESQNQMTISSRPRNLQSAGCYVVISR